jgi:hypothetical protein
VAITRLKTSSIIEGFPKSKSVLTGNDAIYAGSYESIETVTVGSGGSSTITFSSIPQTYAHLQLRCFTNSGCDRLQFNSDTAANYTRHYILGNGTAASSGASTGATYSSVIDYTNATSTFAGSVVDILDYKDTNKFKTIRSLTGFDTNSQGEIFLFSGLWRSTAAISTITITGGTAAQYSSFALYGIN